MEIENRLVRPTIHDDRYDEEWIDEEEEEMTDEDWQAYYADLSRQDDYVYGE